MRYIVLRSGLYYYYRRTPKEVAELDNRASVRVSLKTDSLSLAEKRAAIVNQATEDYWDSLLKFGSDNAREKYEGAIALAQRLGFVYKTADALAATDDLADLLTRVEALETKGVHNEAYTSALLGGEKKPPMTLQDALEKYYALSKADNLNKNDDQLKRWKNPRIKAVKNFIDVCGDKPIDAITRDDALTLRDWWVGRIEQDSISPHSANKDLSHLSQIIQKVSDSLRLNIENPFSGLRLRESQITTRLPFTNEHIRDVLLKPESLAELNEDARLILYAMVETGARPNELAGLAPEDIILDHEVPHIHIRANSIRSLKTPHSDRKIPLIGVALEALQSRPNGFPRYHAKNTALSGAINKFLKENELLPSAQHSLYSLRHSFQDRLIAVEAPERVQAELMGHKFIRPKYGKGPTLKQKREWLERMD